jgi:hypothetical protein
MKEPEKEPLLTDHRAITFMVPMEIWEQIRAMTFKKRMSLRIFYEEFTRMIIAGDADALKVVSNIMVNGITSYNGRNYTKNGGKLDNDTVYDILAREGVI